MGAQLVPEIKKTTKMIANSVKYMFGASTLYPPWHQLQNLQTQLANTHTSIKEAWDPWELPKVREQPSPTNWDPQG